MNIFIRNGKLLLPDADSFRISEGDVWISDNTICRILEKRSGEIPSDSTQTPDRIIDASGRLVMPGLINAHTHAYMSLFRNYADDMEFFDWLHSVEVVEDRLSAEDCYWATLLSVAEMLRTGTTCFADMCLRSAAPGALSGPGAAVSGAVNDSGIRAFLSRGLVGNSDDEGSLRRLNEFLADAAQNRESRTCRFLLGPHAPYSCEKSLLKLVRETGLQKNMMATIHISESEAEMQGIAQQYNGMTPVEYVADSGLFDLNVIAAHLVNATDTDIALLKEKNVSVAINPSSNMKLGNGFAPVEKFLDAGLNICLGTDGCGSNNTQNMFREMNIAALVYKGAGKKARCVDAADVVRFATTGGAKALCMQDELGVLREGALADIIILDLNVPEFVPQNNLVSALCYCANGSEVRTVIIDGQVVMEEGRILTFDEQEVFRKCEKIVARLM